MPLSPRDQQILALLREEGMLDPIKIRILRAQVSAGHYGSVEQALHSSESLSVDEVHNLLRKLDETTSAALDFSFADADSRIDIERLTGEEVAGYRLVRKVGHGAMGVVYYGVPAEGSSVPNEPRAIKLLKPRFGEDHRYLIRFLREARTMEKLEHEGLVRAHGHGVWAGVPFLAMEFIDGPNLDNLIQKNRALLERRVIWLAMKLLPPLQALHRAGIVHRDLKPSNILIDQGYGPRITDFGVIAETTPAGKGPSSVKVTRIGSIIGTGAYLPPELCHIGDEEPAIDGRADLYSLGCVLYACLTGNPPFHKWHGLELYAAHRELPPPPISPERGVSSATEEFVGRLLAKNPFDRPSSATLARREAAKIWKRLREERAGQSGNAGTSSGRTYSHSAAGGSAAEDAPNESTASAEALGDDSLITALPKRPLPRSIGATGVRATPPGGMPRSATKAGSPEVRRTPPGGSRRPGSGNTDVIAPGGGTDSTTRLRHPAESGSGDDH